VTCERRQQSVEWGLLPICVKCTVTRGIYLSFFHSYGTLLLERNSHLDHYASIDADFLKEVPFGVLRPAKKILGVIFAPKNLRNVQLLNGTR
jgi:hypothetical protein